MNKIFLLGFFIFTPLIYGQSVLESPWTIGLGVNIVDNDGFQFDAPFDSDNWNFSIPLTVSVEKRIDAFWAANFAITLNRLTTDNLQNNGHLPEDETLFAVDVTARYYFDQLFQSEYRLNPIQGFLVSGFGFTSAGEANAVTFDIGIGVNFWVIENVGIKLQTLGKFGFKHKDQFLKNYIQHSVEVIYRFRD